VLYIVPPLAVIVLIAALYAIYLFYLGLPPVMSTPPNQVVPYMLVSAVVIIVISFVLGALATAMFGISGYRTI
jgi:hypothetical protein